MGIKNLNVPFSEEELREWEVQKDQYGMTWKEMIVEGWKALRKARA